MTIVSMVTVYIITMLMGKHHKMRNKGSSQNFKLMSNYPKLYSALQIYLQLLDLVVTLAAPLPCTKDRAVGTCALS